MYKVQKKISIIIPIYNEEKNIPLIYTECQKVLSQFKNQTYVYEYLFINDGSKDNSYEEIRNLMAHDERVVLVDFSRNFGKEAALSAGIEMSSGDAVLMIDADLQHDPGAIPDFIKAWEAGAEVVIGKRKSYQGFTWFRRNSSKLYNKIIQLISKEHLPGTTDYRLLDRQVVNVFKSIPEHDRITRGLIDWLGFKRSFVYFDSLLRKHGQPNYSYTSLVRLAIYGFVTQSLLPLKIAGYFGIIIMFFSLLLGGYTFYDTFILGANNFSGAFMSAIFTMFLMSINLICLGLVALYVGSIKNDTRGRPLYIVRQRLQLDQKEKKTA